MKTIFSFLFVIAGTLSFSYQQKTGSFTDERDNRSYKTVQIGTQWWMAENLNYATGSASWCYDDNADNCLKYGRLYDWTTAQKICPKGWHLPSKAEVETMLNLFGDEGGEAVKELLEGGKSGLNAKLGGWIDRGSYSNLDDDCDWWITENEPDWGWAMSISVSADIVHLIPLRKTDGASVRCIKDK